MKGNKQKGKKGFTLIELLVVIAIIAILSVVVILTLNPAELLRQSRDSNRISDLSILKSAISFYLVSVNTPWIGSSTVCDVGSAIATTTCWTGAGGWFATDTGNTAALPPAMTSTVRTVDGLGWIRGLAFTSISAGGSPIGSLPIDPSYTDNIHYYSYIASSTGLVFKLGAFMESAKYGLNGPSDVVSTDGGSSSSVYEVGTNLQL